MKINLIKWSIERSVILSLVCISIQLSPFLVVLIEKPAAYFYHKTDGIYEADTSALKIGNYFFSLVKPGFFCDVYADDKLIDTNRSVNSKLFSKISLGIEFEVTEKNRTKNFTVKCDQIQHNIAINSFAYEPVIFNFYFGLTFYLLRVFILCFLGPIASGVLLLFFLINRKIFSNWNKNFFEFLLFVLTIFFYTLNNSGFTRLFFQIDFVVFAHMLLRGLVAFSFIFLIQRNYRTNNFLILSHIFSVFLTFIEIVFLKSKIDYLYNFHLIFYTISTLFLVYEVATYPSNVKYFLYLRILAITWAIMHIFAWLSYTVNSGLMFSSSFFAMVCFFVFYLNYREKIESEMKTESMKSELNYTERISRLALQVAHDIRSPLNALGVLLQKASFKEEVEREILDSSIKRIKKISNDLLILSKEKFVSSYSLSSIDIKFVVDKIIKEKNIEFKLSKSVTLKNKVSENIKVKADESDFERIISNLLNNSIESLTKAEGTVEVTAKLKDEFIEIEFLDNGCGIESELIEKILKEGGSFNKKHGTGLGIADAKRKVELWGGALTIDSTPNIGTKITLRLLRG